MVRSAIGQLEIAVGTKPAGVVLPFEMRYVVEMKIFSRSTMSSSNSAPRMRRAETVVIVGSQHAGSWSGPVAWQQPVVNLAPPTPVAASPAAPCRRHECHRFHDPGVLVRAPEWHRVWRTNTIRADVPPRQKRFPCPAFAAAHAKNLALYAPTDQRLRRLGPAPDPSVKGHIKMLVSANKI
jgi:hypothetical protein